MHSWLKKTACWLLFTINLRFEIRQDLVINLILRMMEIRVIHKRSLKIEFKTGIVNNVRFDRWPVNMPRLWEQRDRNRAARWRCWTRPCVTPPTVSSAFWICSATKILRFTLLITQPLLFFFFFLFFFVQDCLIYLLFQISCPSLLRFSF